MSNKKAASKITLGLLKGKSMNTSVPSIAVRFNASAEEVEELYHSDDESEQTTSERIKSAGDPESSPLRYLSRLGKRSVSTENSLATHDSSPTSDPWKFFSGIKGKITKNIEDTITEIKHRNQDGDTSLKKGKDYKENQSDSEEISESSISKTCGATSTTEGVEMSTTDEDTPSLEKDKKTEEKSRPVKDSSDVPAKSSSAGLRRRIKVTKKEKHTNNTKEANVGIITLGKLYELNTGLHPSDSSPIMNDIAEVERGIEALEDTSWPHDSPITERSTAKHGILLQEIVAKVTDNIDNLKLEDDEVISMQSVSGSDIRKAYLTSDNKYAPTYFAPEGFVDLRGIELYSNSWFNKIYGFRRFIFLICCIVLYLLIPLPVYLSGFIAGAVFALAVSFFYSIFISTNTAVTGLTNRPFASHSEIVLTMPIIKEHTPISSFEGWMNEYPEEYDPLSYQVLLTQSVYIRLQGNLLRISNTQAKIPKRAMWNEAKHKRSFTQHRIYNMLGAKISLLPIGLHKKRYWHKKYPICIILNKDPLHFDCPEELVPPTVADVLKEQTQDSKTKTKKKVVLQPQIYSKLSEETINVETELEFDDTDTINEDVTSMASKCTESGNEDENADETSQLYVLDYEEHPEDDVLSLDDWSAYSPLESPTQTHIYLFGRSGREKEDWFRRLVAATHACGSDPEKEEFTKMETNVQTTLDPFTNALKEEADYLKYMSQFLKAAKNKDGNMKEAEYLQAVNVLWLNAVMGRLLYDWARDINFIDKLKEKIQRKLMTIKLPYFIEQISVSELCLGDTAPLIHNTSSPSLDQRGLWVDLDISYQGNLMLILQTKLNLMKLKEPHHNLLVSKKPSSKKWQSSDAEDTAESSTDDDGHVTPPAPKLLTDKTLPSINNPNMKSKGLMRMVDKIAESKIFQAATDNRYIKRAMEGVSNTDLSLKVEVKGLIGTLVLNIPPPPSDRLWLGFRPAPKMFLTAQPIVGERNISFIKYLTNWIEKRLCKEFHKVLVIPNMEDFSIPGMSSELPK